VRSVQPWAYKSAACFNVHGATVTADPTCETRNSPMRMSETGLRLQRQW
jgi:hypothetical protein